MNIKEIDKKIDEFENRTYECSECLGIFPWGKTRKTRDGRVCDKCYVSYTIRKLEDEAIACGVLTEKERRKLV